MEVLSLRHGPVVLFLPQILGAPLIERGGSIRVMHPLFHEGDGGSSPTSPLRARDLVFSPCDKMHAVRLVHEWHSRLPNCQRGPWQFAFHGHRDGITYAVALWNTPSGRCLPQHWLELRRMACAPDSPKNTPSRFLAWMTRYFSAHHPQRERCISYQDTAVHQGTIYKAAGWTAAHVSKPRIRDRTGKRAGTRRDYRWNLNGTSADASAKVRWEFDISKEDA